MRTANDRLAHVAEQIDSLPSCSQGGEFARKPREQLFVGWRRASYGYAVLIALNRHANLSMQQLERPITNLFAGDVSDSRAGEMFEFAAGISLRAAMKSIMHLVTSTCRAKRFDLWNIGS